MGTNFVIWNRKVAFIIQNEVPSYKLVFKCNVDLISNSLWGPESLVYYRKMIIITQKKKVQRWLNVKEMCTNFLLWVVMSMYRIAK